MGSEGKLLKARAICQSIPLLSIAQADLKLLGYSNAPITDFHVGGTNSPLLRKSCSPAPKTGPDQGPPHSRLASDTQWLGDHTNIPFSSLLL